MAFWCTCVSNSSFFSFFFCVDGKNAAEVITHSKMRSVNFGCNTRSKSTYGNGGRDKAARQVEMKRSGMQEEGKQWWNKTVETQTVQIHAVSLHVRGFFLFSLSQESQWSGGGGDWSAYQNERLQQFPATPVVITSIPPPSVFLDVLTRWSDVTHRAVWLIRKNWSV